MLRRALLTTLLPGLLALPAKAQDAALRDWAALTREERRLALRRLRAGQKARETAPPAGLGARWDAMSPTQRAELLLPPSRRM
jgi:hypothetical protein